jgi:hypothetical protein
MVRDKAGHAGTDRNLIMRTDVLAALGIDDAQDLLPCPAAIVDVGVVVEREQLADAINIVQRLSIPLMIHSAGGGGKTVFMNSLANALGEHNEVVLFDCFGGGAYRAPEDARHLPHRGLIHIANTLAFRGLCDPILPGGRDVSFLLRTFRRRLEQCVATLKRVAQAQKLILFIDAIDNAELFARERSEDSFPTLLLEAVCHKPVGGVKLIVSCRTERKPTSTAARLQEFELHPFSIEETRAYLRSRVERVSEMKINVAQARSGGNPRVLEYLVKSGRGLLDQSEIHKPVELNDLIQRRILEALGAALSRGSTQDDIDAFLAGLSVLPPPVPLDEYAEIGGIHKSAVESFASDLRPLLERTSQGLMFRDEPTETLIRDRYGSSLNALRSVATNLLARQGQSVYAARALPGLLQKLDDGERLFALAFDERIPASITSTVGKRNVRYARLKAATLHAAIKGDHNRLVRLLVELSTIAAVDQRGAAYILDCPDLVVAAKDVDAKRRLFETRTSWPGARHAGLVVANCLTGELEEASRHANWAYEWIGHYRRTDDKGDRARPDQSDIAAIPFFLICRNRPRDAASFLGGWKDWFSYEVCEHLFAYCELVATLRPSSAPTTTEFVSTLTSIGPLVAAVSFQQHNERTKINLVRKLSRACRKEKRLELPLVYQRRRAHEIGDGLRKASAIALSLGLRNAAKAIASVVPSERPGMWSLRNDYYRSDVFPFVFQNALASAANRKLLHENDVMPKELLPICSGISRELTGQAFRSEMLARLREHVSTERDEHGQKKDSRMLGYDEKQEAERFISHHLEPLFNLTKTLKEFLAADARSVNDAYIDLVKCWENARQNHWTCPQI